MSNWDQVSDALKTSALTDELGQAGKKILPAAIRWAVPYSRVLQIIRAAIPYIQGVVDLLGWELKPKDSSAAFAASPPPIISAQVRNVARRAVEQLKNNELTRDDE